MDKGMTEFDKEGKFLLKLWYRFIFKIKCVYWPLFQAYILRRRVVMLKMDIGVVLPPEGTVFEIEIEGGPDG